MNPDSGGKPPEGGASAAGRPDEKSGRRRKAKRSGKPPSAAVAHGIDKGAGPDAGRPDIKDDTGPPRKRKRRRSRGAKGQGQGKGQGGGAEAVAGTPDVTGHSRVASSRTSGGSHAASARIDGGERAGKGEGAARENGPSRPDGTVRPDDGAEGRDGRETSAGRRRRRGRAKGEARSLQGRPLAPTGKGGAGRAGHASQGHSDHSSGSDQAAPHGSNDAPHQAGHGARTVGHAARHPGSRASPHAGGGHPGGHLSGQAGGGGRSSAGSHSGPQSRSHSSGAHPHGAHGPHSGHAKGGHGKPGFTASAQEARGRTGFAGEAAGTVFRGVSDRPTSDRPTSERGASDRGAPDDLYAALDLGTNNCRLLIAQPTRPGQFRVVDAFSRIVRLGEGLAATGRLSTEAMDRAVEALRICALKLANRPIRKMRLIATEACRAAANGEEFLARVTRETGLELEIIDRETEARLAVSGCSSLVGREARSVVLFDIGGGSSEIAVIRIRDNRSSRLANHITHWTSLPVGVVTLSERHGGQNVTPAVFSAMVDEVEGMLAGFECPALGEESTRPDEDFHLIGTSGTVTTLAGVHLDLPRYDRRKVDGLWLSDAEVSAMQEKLLSWDFEGRAANPCIGPDRADLVLAGCAILEAIRRRWPSQRMRVADRGLREGLLTDMMADDGVWRRFRGRRPGDNAARGATENHR
jgi:exopolyphosphatase / guanosine-5'-triphosphate,3'-diphosphate pyrophosphatase